MPGRLPIIICYGSGILSLLWASVLHAAEGPSPLALLHAVEAARMRHDTLSARLTYEYVGGGENRRIECMVDVDVDGSHRRFEHLRGEDTPGEVVIIDGQELHGFRRKKHEDVCVYDMRYAVGVRGDVAFDPRILGLSDVMAADATVKGCLWYEHVRDLELIGGEELNGVPLWRVRATAEDTVSDFWIEEPSFRVHRRTIEWSGGRVEIDSYFDSVDSSSPLPVHVHARRSDDGGRSIEETKVTVKHIELGVPVAPERFSISSMELPRNTAIVDYRIQRVIGYWDGSRVIKSLGLQDEMVDMIDPENERQQRGVRLFLIVVNIAFIAGLAVFIWMRRSRLAA